MYLGIEIGGTKLQAACGLHDGQLWYHWQGTVQREEGADGILRQFRWVITDLVRQAEADGHKIDRIGVGYGGPVDLPTGTVIKSHHIHGWTGFPLQQWLEDFTGIATVVANDADVAGLGEACHGAGKNIRPLAYLTVGSGIGGAFFADNMFLTGCGKGAMEIGHLKVGPNREILEHFSSGWGIEARYQDLTRGYLRVPEIAAFALHGQPEAQKVLDDATTYLANALTHMITLLCPRCIVIGGGVSLLGNELFFAPLLQKVAAQTFEPYQGQTEIVPARLGQSVVLHGAIALAALNPTFTVGTK